MAAAAANPLVSLYEYLHSDFQPDMDYVDGVLEERNLGENAHADLQTELAVLFRTHKNEWKVKTYVEHRVQISPTRYRVPDLCIMPASWKKTPIISDAPRLCIEILSPEDRFDRVRARCEDYFRIGAPEVWIIDPAQRTAVILRADGTMATVREDSLHLEGTPVDVSLAQLFAVLDED